LSSDIQSSLFPAAATGTTDIAPGRRGKQTNHRLSRLRRRFIEFFSQINNDAPVLRLALDRRTIRDRPFDAVALGPYAILADTKTDKFRHDGICPLRGQGFLCGFGPRVIRVPLHLNQPILVLVQPVGLVLKRHLGFIGDSRRTPVEIDPTANVDDEFLFGPRRDIPEPCRRCVGNIRRRQSAGGITGRKPDPAQESDRRAPARLANPISQGSPPPFNNYPEVPASAGTCT